MRYHRRSVSKLVNRSARFTVESLESRTLLSAGDVDVKLFSPDGHGGPNNYGPMNYVAIAPALDGKILVALNAGEGPQKTGNSAVSRFNSDATADASLPFTFIPPDNRYLSHTPVLNTILVEPDGKILVAGYLIDLTVSPNTSDFLLGRFNPDGALDESFGADGTLVTSLPGNEQVTSLALDSIGNIYAEGPSFNYPNTGFDLAQYSPSGVLLKSYAANLGSNGGQPGPTAMGLAPGGDIYVGGSTGANALVWRFNSALDPDPSFAAAGVTTTPLPAGDSGSVSAINFTPDGHLVAAGTVHDASGSFGTNTYFLSRLASTGAPDATFGSSGTAIVPLNFASSPYPLAGLVTQSDGKLLIAGTASHLGAADTQLVFRRYLANGAPDPTFHADQDPNLAGNGSGLLAYSLTLDNRGRPLISGSVAGGTGFARYQNDVTPPGLSANFSGRPIPVPNYPVEAEDFDTGGEGVGYHDTTPQNTGGAYRPNEGVDIGFDTGQAQYATLTNNYVVLDTQPGEWLQYTISVATPGLYHLRAATKDFWTGGQFHGEIDGANVTGEMTVFQSYDGSYSIVIPSKAFYLGAGIHLLRIVMDKAGPTGTVGRFDRFYIDEAGGGTVKGGGVFTTPFDISTDTIEAEDFDFGDYRDTTPQNINGLYRPFESVDINAGGSNGYSVGYAMKGEYLDYLINSPTNSVYQLQARVASFKPGGTFHVEIDGHDVTGPMTIPDTGPWDTWTTLTSPAFAVSPDIHSMRVVMDQSGYWQDVIGDFDYFKFIKTNQAAPPVVYDPSRNFPRDIHNPVQATAYDVAIDTNGAYHNGEGVVYHDTTPQNLGQQGNGRWGDAVDIISTLDPHVQAYTWNLAVGYTAPGEWIDYTVNIPASGTYAITSTVANLGPGGTFHFEFDGIDKTGPISVPDTGGYYNWSTVTSPFFNVTAGVHVMRIVMDSPSAVGNIGNFQTFQFTPRLANSVTLTSTYPSITLSRDPDGTHIDWNNTSSDHGFFAADDPAGFTVNTEPGAPSPEIWLDYSHGNPLPSTLHLNGNIDIFGFQTVGGNTIDIGTSTVNFHANNLSVFDIFRQALQVGYNGGQWNGAAGSGVQFAINSSALTPGSRYTLGYANGADNLAPSVPYGVFQIRYTLAGDANLDGTVDALDAITMARNYLRPGINSWDQGNFNYDNTIDFSDAKLLQSNFRLTMP